jgi:hypothetical protein
MLLALASAAFAARATYFGNWTVLTNVSSKADDFDRFQITFMPSNAFPTVTSSFVLQEAIWWARNSSETHPFPESHYSLYGFLDPPNSSYLFFTLRGNKLPSVVFQHVSNELSNFTDFVSQSGALHRHLSSSIPSLLLSLTFVTHPIEITDDPYELPSALNGTLHIGDLELDVYGECFDLDGYISSGRIFGVLNSIYLVVSFYSWFSIVRVATPALLHSLSVHAFLHHSSFDIGYGLFFLTIGISFRIFSRLFILLFLLLFPIYFVLEMGLVIRILGAANHVTNLRMPEMRVVFLMFVAEVAIVMVLCSLSILLMFRRPLLPLLFLYSSFVPQILQSISTGSRKAADSIFTILVTANRLFVLWYFFVYERNILSSHSVPYAVVISLYIVAQMVVVLLQNKIGPAFLLPRRFQVGGFDYTAAQIDWDTVCSICMRAIEQEEAMTTPCGHSFHAECLGRWMQQEMICPLCRDVLPEPRRRD